MYYCIVLELLEKKIHGDAKFVLMVPLNCSSSDLHLASDDGAHGLVWGGQDDASGRAGWPQDGRDDHRRHPPQRPPQDPEDLHQARMFFVSFSAIDATLVAPNAIHEIPMVHL